VQHAKYFIVDGREIFLGSQNFDWRALKHIHELGIRIQQQNLSQFILKIFNLDWDVSANSNEMKNIRKITLPNSALINQENPVQINWQDESISIYPTFSPKEYIFPGMAFDEEQLLNLIGDASEKIHIQLLSYSPVDHGEYYPALENALRNAALRGVQVKVLVSDWNKRKPGIDYLKSLQVLENVEVKLSTIPQYSGEFIPFARVEHCKYMVVDDSLTWIGTSNWGKNYFYASRNLGLIIKGNSVNSIVEKVFLKSWDSEYTNFVDPSMEYELPRISE
jgi:phosphatidylserine/phosphatidylglycerophosphate/cardiolipin synthase-like enzyme